MKMLIRSLLVCVLLVSSTYAQEEITGAFGLKLGAVFDPKGAQPMEGRENIYPFTPTTPLKGLTNYSVLVTPKTGRIAAIYASGHTPEAASAWDLATMLGIALRNKYGSTAAPESPQSENSAFSKAVEPPRPRFSTRGGLLDEPTRITQGQRVVEIAARDQSEFPPGLGRKGSVYLGYWDNALMAEVSKEADLINEEQETAKKAAQEAREKAAREEWEQKRTAESERRAKMRDALKEEAKKLDVSAL